jgi:hypothetical protein
MWRAGTQASGPFPDCSRHWRIIGRIRVALQISLVLLLLEITAWILSLGYA